MLLASCGSGDGDLSASPAPSTSPTPTPSPTPSPTASPTPTSMVALTGNIAPAHDPAILKDGNTYYLFTTGNNGDAEGLLALRTSTDLKDWTLRGGSYTALPAWTATAVPGSTGMWAPDISKVGNQYRLYYSISTFGKNQSAIGLATATVIDPTKPAANWVDQGPVIQSTTSDNYNAIDPMAFTDADGRAWMTFGSFWSGIKLIQLDPATGLRLANDPAPRALASRPSPGAIEAPYIVRHGGYYYLFASFDSCCQGANSTYNTVVGRSATVDGPYVDRDGKAMLQGGGTQVLSNGQGTGSRFVGRGHVAILQQSDGDYIVYHAYDTTKNGFPTLQIQKLTWSTDGWPSV
ncbi:ABC transporter substrate-binding protein [Sphingomonas endophytica]|uniref:Extracellular exo-alpha-(1->5)-L-arabinofuranosidase n=1 Tax=Sphingomonas endophytica TaxID=869719 RepID=A0A147HWC5_9SPHN|nr:ABC transporter substrate-binding protein [Sphingomonas endophytica]